MLATYLDPIGAVLSLLTTLSFVRVSRIGWLLGLVTTLLKIVLYYDRGLYGQVGLKCIFVVMMCYGWYHWRDRGPEHVALPIRRLSGREWMVLLATAGVSIPVLQYVLVTYLNSTVALFDSAITVLALCAQYLLTQKIIENWVLWFVINIMVVSLYADVGLPFNAAVHFTYLFLSIIGYRKWHKILQGKAI
jgi:nicotinamide mononucleotide transporter